MTELETVNAHGPGLCGISYQRFPSADLGHRLITCGKEGAIRIATGNDHSSVLKTIKSVEDVELKAVAVSPTETKFCVADSANFIKVCSSRTIFSYVNLKLCFTMSFNIRINAKFMDALVYYECQSVAWNFKFGNRLWIFKLR